MNYQLQVDTQNFFKVWKDKVNPFPSIPGECVSIVKQYFQDILKIPVHHGNAKSYLNGVPGFTLIHPDGDNKPEFGDLVIFNYPPDDHIGILNWTSASFINCFEQNFPLKSPCHFQTHDYTHIAGWLHWNGSHPQKTLKIARIGNLPDKAPFLNLLTTYGIKTEVVDYSIHINNQDSLNQESTYNLLDFVNPQETFIQIFYTSTQAVPYATSYASPKGKYVSTLPTTDPAVQAFELSHCLQLYCNDKFNAHLPVDDVAMHSYQDPELTKKKFLSVAPYLLTS